MTANSFYNIKANAYYYGQRAGWSPETLQNYGGELNWNCMDGEKMVISIPTEVDTVYAETFMGSGAQVVEMSEGV